MVTCGKRRLLSPLLPLSVAAILFLAVFAVACGDTAPIVAPELQAPAMEPTSAPAVTAEQEASTSPQAPVASSGQTTGAGGPLPTATSVPPSPTSTPPPKPAGYLHGAEHGIALLQTTRQPSETREGWVDISLTLATLKFGGDVASREHRVEPNSMCYVNRQPPDDCLFIAWGSEEQFEAEIRASHWTSDPGRALKTDILVVTFEAAANANKASLYFGDQHKIPIDLQGDATPVEPNANPALAPAPSASSGKSAGYFVDTDYGIAVTGVRRGQSSSHPTISLIDVDISVLSLAEGEEVAAAINVGVADNSDICLGHSSRMECLRIKWGPESQFDAALVIKNEINVAWPRGMGLQLPFRFVVPSSTEQATVEFGEHRIPIDLKGMTGEAPAYDYRLHYQELAAGSTLYDSNRKRVVLEAIRQKEDAGRIVLVFSVTNDSEAADFAPAIEMAGSRVSESGTVFDGELDAAAGWTPPTYQFELGRLAPGQNTKTEIAISRVVGQDRERWRLISYSPNPEERPDGVVLQLTVSDSLTGAGTPGPISGYAAYDRFPGESDYWAGTLNGISYAFQSFHVISSALDEYGDHDAECKSRLGNQYRLADWNDLTSWVSGGGSIPELIAGLRLRKEGDPASIYPHDGAEIDGSLPKVSLNGEERLNNGRRHFFISRHDHVLPGYFLAHAHIDNYHISLGSWYGEGGTTLCYNMPPGTGTVVGTGTEPAAPMANGISYAFQSFHVISSALDEYGDHDAECKSRLGNQYRLADWNDLTSWVSGGGSIPELIAGLRLRKEGDPASIYPHDGAEIDGSLPKVSLNGEERLNNGRRHFFISRHDHVLPGYFLAHAHIDNYHISLGSWYVEGGTTLCYNPTL